MPATEVADVGTSRKSYRGVDVRNIGQSFVSGRPCASWVRKDAHRRRVVGSAAGGQIIDGLGNQNFLVQDPGTSSSTRTFQLSSTTVTTAM